mmetsp:Transcript_15874/g.36422  ORF Transcript_15874/g.36422 Transcript_15874/m.36422 type:complete len:424 (+) Transcript_15874:62-1333(+)|eukprot:CAMPEP_0201188086 /NCGR_PEP_ID=MMETSP0851-20130426/134725_1 /ASSEMBLY_ACC=CAM_ASM_000631 /TAXON_ID=183588 /ORGANISM="Pseudo-nitzschia fraudulenta, Strain WWA7" /LENGTH=423 /DNA_ID=CAMNT_0047473651 /DNA_START=62 /DNA_END=1333 /DNA_ORIENTATION=+
MTVFSKNLQFLPLLFLLCGRVAGERGLSSKRRRTAIGDRPTIDDGDASDDVGGKGGVGKGMKSEKSYKSLKELQKLKHENDISPGKGMKSDKTPKSEKMYGKGLDMSMTMSMDIELPGKGAKTEKERKSSKSGKSAKKIKREKGVFGKGGISPSLDPATPSPTSADSISSKSSPFAITYSPLNGIPSSDDLQELTMVTQKYLEDFMMNFFEKTALTDLDNFLTIMVRDAFVDGEPALAEYQSNGLFNPDSIFIPVKREIDNLIKDAIAHDEYLGVVKGLPRSNPFRGTKTIAFTEANVSAGAGETTSSSDGESSSSFVRAGVAAAAAGVVVLAAGLAMLKSRRPSVDDDDTQSFSPGGKSTTEDLTIAGDTCTMSVDDSTGHFAHWRTAKSYNNVSEGGEFQDEPLDSDDELSQKMMPVSSLS